MARPARFELATPAFGGQYSIQLSYGRFIYELSQILYMLDTENLRERIEKTTGASAVIAEDCCRFSTVLSLSVTNSVSAY